MTVMIWDYRMRWAPPSRPHAYRGGGWPYPYGEEVFLADVRACADYLSSHRYDGMVIWGLFRDVHGGERAVHIACEHANRRGIPILATVGVACYGGAYWEGDHRFNLNVFLERNPALAALDADGHPILKGESGHAWSMACPSHPLVREWTAEGVEWLARNFDIGGVELQCGDYGVCTCPRCRERAGDDRASKFSFRDVVDLTAEPLRVLHGIRGDLLLTVNAYMPVREGRNQAGSVLRDGLPPYAHVTWWCHTSPVCVHPMQAWPTLDCDLPRYVPGADDDGDGPLPFDLPGQRNIGLMVVNTAAYHADRHIFLADIARMARLAHRIGLDGIMIYGELAEFTHRVNYLALEAFVDNPRMSLPEFWQWAAKDGGLLAEG